jgi:hypothetical protein
MKASSEWTPEAAELLRAARSEWRPRSEDCERVLGALLPRVEGTLPAASTAGLSAGSATVTGFARVVMLVVGIGAAGVGIHATTGSAPVEPAARLVAVSQAPPPEAPSMMVAETSHAAAAIALEPAPQPKRSPEPLRATDPLAQEVSILSRAGAALRSRQATTALSLLDEHQRKFPRAVLAEERSSTRIQALCQLGRHEDARRQLTELAKMSPNSPHVARVRKACGFARTVEAEARTPATSMK